jgi:hypothetical protein
MSHLGLADLIEAVFLYQLDNPAETGFHVGRQDIELFSNRSSSSSTIHVTYAYYCIFAIAVAGPYL